MSGGEWSGHREDTKVPLSPLRVRIDAWGSSYTIESSPDGESWQPVGGETERECYAVWRTFEFSRRVVLHFRVTMKEIEWVSIRLTAKLRELDRDA